MRNFPTMTRSRRRFNQAKIALTFATCALALFIQNTHAKAQYAQYPGKTATSAKAPSYKHVIAYKFNELMIGLNNSDCIGVKHGRKVAFMGIPSRNIHLSEFVRSSLNTQALEQLTKRYGGLMRFNAVENLGFDATLGENSKNGQSRIGRSIDALLKSSPYVLAMQTLRPQKDAVQIKINLLARGKDGVTHCSKSAEVIVRLADFTVIDAAHIDSRENRNFVQAKWVYPYILEQFSSDIIAFKRLRVINDFALNGRCELRANAAKQFRSSYFRFRDEQAGRFAINRKDWPRLRLEKTLHKPSPSTLKVEKGDGILYLRYSRSNIDRDVINVTLEFYSGGDVINSTHISMLIDARNVEGCRPPSDDPLVDLINGANRKGLNFSVHSIKEKFKVGVDHVKFRIQSDQPLYFHCLSIGADGTSRLAFPWDKSQLNNPFGTGETRTYPDDFRLSALILQQDARELFGCYASPTRLPELLENRWLAAHPFNAAKNAKSGILTFDETKQFLGWLDATPNTGSAFTWLRSSR